MRRLPLGHPGTWSLQMAASACLALTSPLLAKRIVDFLGRHLSTLSVSSAVRAAAALEGHGTCLARSFALAARLPGAEVVIAIAPQGARGPFAHAWVEHHGQPLRPHDVGGSEIARLRGYAAPVHRAT
jgi:hypothetical protein